MMRSKAILAVGLSVTRKSGCSLALGLFCSLVYSDHCWAAFNLGGGENYAILFEGVGNNHLQVTNVTVNGNIGVGNTGIYSDSGPSTVTGTVDFSDTVTSRFQSNNAANTFNGGQHSPPYMGNFGVAQVTNSLNWVNSMSQTLLGDAGTPIAINGIQTVNASSGAVYIVNGQSVHVFDATSFNNNGTSDVLTINGTASDLVAFNLDGLGNIQFHGGIAFSGGIGADNVLFNIGGGNYTTMTGAASLDINNNSGAAGIARGIFLDPNGAISVTNSVINEGRVFGGDAHDFQDVSGSNITAPVPEPTTIGLLTLGSGLVMIRRRGRS